MPKLELGRQINAMSIEPASPWQENRMIFTVLASGSSGNASLVECGGAGVLIDAGLGPRLLASRLKAFGIAWTRIHAVLLTHTHADHWKERTFAQMCRDRVRLYCHAEHCGYLESVSRSFAELMSAGLVEAFEPVHVLSPAPGFQARAFPVRHDGGPNFGYRIEGPSDLFGDRAALAYLSDLGSWSPALCEQIGDVDLLALEFNHDVEMERRSGRSRALVERVLGDYGHLSNEQAADLLGELLRRGAPGRMRHLVQLHLSRDCNRPHLARSAALRATAEAEVRVHTAAQHRPGPRIDLLARRTSPKPVVRELAQRIALTEPAPIASLIISPPE